MTSEKRYSTESSSLSPLSSWAPSLFSWPISTVLGGGLFGVACVGVLAVVVVAVVVAGSVLAVDVVVVVVVGGVLAVDFVAAGSVAGSSEESLSSQSLFVDTLPMLLIMSLVLIVVELKSVLCFFLGVVDVFTSLSICCGDTFLFGGGCFLPRVSVVVDDGGVVAVLNAMFPF